MGKLLLYLTGWVKNWDHIGPTHEHNYVRSNRFKHIFSGRFPGKFVVKWILKIKPHLAYVATLPCETLMSAKQAINDK